MSAPFRDAARSAATTLSRTLFLTGLILLSAPAFPGPAQAGDTALGFDQAVGGLDGHVGRRIDLEGFLTYLPENTRTAVLRKEQGQWYQSMFAFNVKQFETRDDAGDGAASVGDGAFHRPTFASVDSRSEDDVLIVSVEHLTAEARRWATHNCTFGCRVRLIGPVVRDAAGEAVFEVRELAPTQG